MCRISRMGRHSPRQTATACAYRAARPGCTRRAGGCNAAGVLCGRPCATGDAGKAESVGRDAPRQAIQVDLRQAP